MVSNHVKNPKLRIGWQRKKTLLAKFVYRNSKQLITNKQTKKRALGYKLNICVIVIIKTEHSGDISALFRNDI